MEIRFGPAGLGPVKTAEKMLDEFSKEGIKACEIAFTYGIYIKDKDDTIRIGKKARELDISLSIHAPYYINLNSSEIKKREMSKKRILDCCLVGELLGAENVVFHPGYYGENRGEAYLNIKEGIIQIMKEIDKKGWKINIAAETMGKVNVFGSINEVSRLVRETGCNFCIDFAHILARDKTVDYSLIEKAFPYNKWHVHFSGIVYGEKGEKHHRKTEKEEWINLLKNLPKDKKIVIINESPDMIKDSLSGLKIYSNLSHHNLY